MSVLSSITRWFQKSSSALDASTVAREQQARYNALLGADPDRLTAAVTAFNCGHLAPLARIIEDYERRDDKMKTCSMKMKAAVARCDYSILEREGFQGTVRAKLHADVLKRFWSGVHATSRFNMNERGGLSLLKKQMMDAQSYGFAVHELVWTPLPNGELSCEFIQIPLWHFENRTGRLRFLRGWTTYDGTPMREGEWLVTTGDGIGVAASLCACVKRLTLADWAVFCERCGMPIIHAKTGAAYGSDQWKNLNRALRAIGRDARIQTDSSTDITALSTGGGASQPYTPLVEWADRAIAALYRGADLSTISNADATGASLQGDEASMLEGDACERLSETLHEQVDRFVVRYVTGDAEPLAGISINPTQMPNIDQEIKIDQHLVDLGVKLSKNDALQRYGRTEADPGDTNDSALEKADRAAQIGQNGLFNERDLPGLFKRPLQGVEKREETSGRTTTHEGGDALQRAILAAFSKDTSEAARRVSALISITDPRKLGSEADRLIADLPNLIPEDPALAAVIAEAMASEFARDPSGSSDGEHLANAITNSCPKCHRQMAADGTCSFCARRAANHENGKSAWEKAVSEKADIADAMERDSIGKIDFVWGTVGTAARKFEDGEGLAHILDKHPGDAGMITGVIAYGDVYEDKPAGKYYIVKKRNMVVLRKRRGRNSYVITGYTKDDPRKVKELRDRLTLVERGE